MSKYILGPIIAVLIILFLIIITNAIKLSAEEINQELNIKEIDRQISQIDHVEVQTEILVPDKEIIKKVDGQNSKIKVSSDPSLEILINEGVTSDLAVEIVNNEELQNGEKTKNGITYISKDDTYAIQVQNVEGGVKQIIYIGDSSAPTQYNFTLDIPENGYANLEEDGGIYVFDMYDEYYYHIDPPYAIDNNGNYLTTYYELNGSEVTQIIVVDETVLYPIIADPRTCVSGHKYVQSTSKKADPPHTGYKLTLKMTDCGVGSTKHNLSVAWNEAKSESKINDNELNKYPAKAQGMYNQFKCHAVYYPRPTSSANPTWDLETWRRNAAYPISYTNAFYMCNP